MIFSMTTLNDRYFEWLCNKVEEPKAHEKLLRQLFDTEFYALPNFQGDWDRAADGQSLRIIFCDENDIAENLTAPATILEVMVALCQRIEDIEGYENEEGDTLHKWFNEMLYNLGFSKPSRANRYYSEEETDYILNRFLERRYSIKGDGSLFYIPDPEDASNMRAIPIWDQMLLYLIYVDE